MTKPGTDSYRRDAEAIVAKVLASKPQRPGVELFREIPKDWPKEARELYWQVAVDMMERCE